MCDRQVAGIKNANFLEKITKYVLEDSLHSTQKIIETEYEKTNFWRQVGKFKLYTVAVEDSGISLATKNFQLLDGDSPNIGDYKCNYCNARYCISWDSD